MATTTERFKPFYAIYTLLLKDDQFLIQRRYKTGYLDGYYGFPSGHVEGNETARQAAVREAAEEAGVIISPDDLEFVHAMHRKSPQNPGFREYVDFFFVCKKWKGEPKIMEPDKCDDIRWISIRENVPENMMPYMKEFMENYKNKVMYSESGWD